MTEPGGTVISFSVTRVVAAPRNYHVVQAAFSAHMHQSGCNFWGFLC